MLNRIIIVFIFFACPFLQNAKIIRSEKLQEAFSTKFQIQRDLFSPEKKGAVRNVSERQKPLPELMKKEKKKEEENKETQYVATIFYEGLLVRDGSPYALLNVNGEFYISKEGDVIPGGIRILKILDKQIVLDIESNEVIIFKKGESNVSQ